MPTVTATNQNGSALKCMEVWGGNGSRENHFVRPGLDVWIQSRAVGCAAAGGSDLYLLSSCSSGRITRMMLADVCSQGAQFAELADQLRDLMKQNINTIRQARFVRETSRRLAESAEHGCFGATMIGTYFSPTSLFSLCNTGNPPPLLFRAEQQFWSVLKQVPRDLPVTRAPSGLADFEEYQSFETKLKAGDMILSFSNALTECCDEHGRTIGMQGLLERVRQLDPRRPATLVATLTAAIRQEYPDNLTIHDATVLLCQGTKTSVPWKDNLLAPLRFLQGAADKTKIE